VYDSFEYTVCETEKTLSGLLAYRFQSRDSTFVTDRSVGAHHEGANLVSTLSTEAAHGARDPIRTLAKIQRCCSSYCPDEVLKVTRGYEQAPQFRSEYVHECPAIGV